MRLLFCMGTILCLVFNISAGASDRVSTGVLAISGNPANRIPPIAATGETFTSFTLEPGVRVTLQAPVEQKGQNLHIILYLLPNGNTTEQTCGRTSSTELDRRYDIQHIAAQTRRVRAVLKQDNVITAYVEADTLSWPAWRKAVPSANDLIRKTLEEIRSRAGEKNASVDLVAHSGGGSFIWGYLNSQPTIPDYVQHIVLLDANYSYENADGHGDKFLAWLKNSEDHQLIVLAYDDRRITINGKPVVSETGGTWRATDRMARYFEKSLAFTGGSLNDLQTSSTLDGRLLFARHPNPGEKILHTVLVERNGFVYSVLKGRTTIQLRDEAYCNSGTELYRSFILP